MRSPSPRPRPRPTAAFWVWVLLAAADGEWSKPPYRTENNSCQETEYYNTNVKMCCSSCPPGKYRKSACTPSQDTVCVPCPPNWYKEEWSPLYDCTLCVGTCGEYLREVQSCSPTTRQICECEPGMFCKSLSLNYCDLCVPHKTCGAGERLIKKGTPAEDGECGPCPPGTFSPVSDSIKCQSHTNCSQLNKRLVKEGTASEDAVCGQVFSTVAASTEPVITTPKTNRQKVDLFLVIGLLLAPLLILIVSGLLFSRKKYFKRLLLSNKSKGSVYIMSPRTVFVGVESGDCARADQEDPTINPPEAHIHFPQQESVKFQNAGESHVYPVEEEEGKVYRDPVPVTEYFRSGTELYAC